MELRQLEYLAAVVSHGSFGRGTALRSLLSDAFAQVDFSPLPRFETNDPQMIRELVSAGLGVGIVPRSWLADDGPAVTSVELAQPLPAYRIAVLATTCRRYSSARTSSAAKAASKARSAVAKLSWRVKRCASSAPQSRSMPASSHSIESGPA